MAVFEKGIVFEFEPGHWIPNADWVQAQLRPQRNLY